MKKTCHGCRALEYRSDYNYVCILGYKIEATRKVIKGLGPIYTPKPPENCPKQRTYKKYREM